MLHFFRRGEDVLKSVVWNQILLNVLVVALNGFLLCLRVSLLSRSRDLQVGCGLLPGLVLGK